MDYQARSVIQAEKTIKGALAVLNLPVRASYTVRETLAILGVSEQTIWRLFRKYELDENGKLKRPDCLKSYILASHRRITYLELVDFIRRNDGYLRSSVSVKAEGEK